jgi:hypothetical protein
MRSWYSIQFKNLNRIWIWILIKRWVYHSRKIKMFLIKSGIFFKLLKNAGGRKYCILLHLFKNILNVNIPSKMKERKCFDFSSPLRKLFFLFWGIIPLHFIHYCHLIFELKETFCVKIDSFWSKTGKMFLFNSIIMIDSFQFQFLCLLRFIDLYFETWKSFNGFTKVFIFFSKNHWLNARFSFFFEFFIPFQYL